MTTGLEAAVRSFSGVRQTMMNKLFTTATLLATHGTHASLLLSITCQQQCTGRAKKSNPLRKILYL